MLPVALIEGVYEGVLVGVPLHVAVGDAVHVLVADDDEDGVMVADNVSLTDALRLALVEYTSVMCWVLV